MQARSRKPRLYLIKDQKVVEFAGKSIPQILVILSEDYEKNGKWSGSDYELAISDTCVAVQCITPWDGWHTIQGWGDAGAFISIVSADKGVDTIEMARAILPAWEGEGGQAALQRILSNERMLAELDI